MIKFYQAGDVCRITELTPNQLREWCGRRAVLAPDVVAAGRGKHALFSWQTMVALRILKDLHDAYGVEVGAWSLAIEDCRRLLRQSSFIALWGQSIVFENTQSAAWADGTHSNASRALIVALDPHLHAIRMSDLAETEMQLPMFKALEAG